MHLNGCPPTIPNPMDKPLYAQPVIELVTVATEYCKYLEQCRGKEPAELCRVMRALLPMVYLKAFLLPAVDEPQGWLVNLSSGTRKKFTSTPRPAVSMARSSVASVLGANDDFLDVFVEDFKYSEQPVLCTVSECLADVYQQLRELVEAFRQGYEDAMQAALYEMKEEFTLQWGQKLLNALRALHDVAAAL